MSYIFAAVFLMWGWAHGDMMSCAVGALFTIAGNIAYKGIGKDD